MPIDPVRALTTGSPATARTTGASAAGPTSDPSATATTNPSIMDKDDFLKLLIGQMRNQDPLNPMDPAESMGQMTQFAILEQVTNLNSTTSAAASNEYDAQAVALIGKHVSYYDPELRDAVSGRVDSVTFTSSGPQLLVDGRTVLPVSLLGVSDSPIEPPADPGEAGAEGA